jgi:PAS domain S-box-containing protein
MAPSTALLMLLLSIAAFLRTRSSGKRSTRLVETVCALVVLGGGALVGLQIVFGFALPLERWLSQTTGTVGKIPVGRMSPVTAGCFVLVSLALLLGRVSAPRWQPLRSLGGWLGLLGLVVGGFITAGYLAGKPFLYGGWTIPMALLTAVAFVLVSAAAILGAGHDAWPVRMFFRERAATDAGAGHRVEWSLLSHFVLLLAAIAVLGLQYLNREQTEARLAAHTQLETIANLKVQQLVQWRKERLADANLVRFTPYAARRALDTLAQPESSRTWQMFTGWLDPLLSGGNYERALLLDAELNVRLVHPAGSSRTLADAVRGPAQQALRTQGVIITDLHGSPGDAQVHLDLLVPLVVRREGTNDNVPAAGLESSPLDRSAGLLVLRVNAHDFLFPLIQTWPTPSPTAETLLVRREGNEVLFINELRHQKDTALSLRRPLNDPRLPAAMGLLGERNVQEGVDYRGVPVVATARPVPDTAWVMVAKVDQAELYAPLRQRALAVVGLALALLLVAALGVTVLWRRRNEHFLRAQLATEHDRRVLAERFEHLMKNASDAILLADEQNRILEANDFALTLYGYSLTELRAMELSALRPVELPAEFARQTEEMAATGQAAFETQHQRKDGTVFPVEISSRLVEIGGVCYKLGIIRDITQRKLHEAEIERLNRLYATLSQVNQVIVRCQTRGELFGDICRVLIEFGQFRAAWIGWKTEAKTQLTTVACRTRDTNSDWAMPGWKGGCGVIAEAVRTGRSSLCNDARTDPRTGCCRETLARLEVQSCAAFPLHLRGEVCGAFSICSIETDFFNAAEIRLLDEVTADISFALDKLDKEAQREAAEAALRRSEAVLAQAGFMARLGAWEIEVRNPDDLTANPLRWSDEVYRIFGCAPGSVVVSNALFFERVHPEDRARVMEGMRQAIASQQPYEVEHRILLPDGAERIVLERAEMTFSAEGRLTRILGAVQDITERKRTELMLEEQLRELQRWHDAMLGREGRVLELKRQVNELLVKAGQSPRYPSAADVATGGSRPAVSGGFQPPEATPEATPEMPGQP